MSWIFLEADDVWCFRDNTPKLTGGSTVIHSVFPPTPSTIQGVLRSFILGASDVDWHDFRDQSTVDAQTLGAAIGYPATADRSASMGDFRMAGPFLARAENDDVMVFTSMPNDVRRAKEGHSGLFSLQPAKEYAFSSNWPTEGLSPLWSNRAEEAESLDVTTWLGGYNLDAYLRQNGAFNGLDAESLYHREPRLGIEIDYQSRNVVESMLYQVEFIRPKQDVGLLIWIDDMVSNHFGPFGTLRIGGEGRNAYYREIPEANIIHPSRIESDEQDGRLKLVLLTPAYFDGGWQPMNGNAGWSELIGSPVTLVSASISQAHRIGGWDIAARNGRGWHKPIRSYVPAGSVYYFETKTTINLDRFHAVTQTPSEQDIQLDTLGYGQVAVGTWNWL